MATTIPSFQIALFNPSATKTLARYDSKSTVVYQAPSASIRHRYLQPQKSVAIPSLHFCHIAMHPTFSTPLQAGQRESNLFSETSIAVFLCQGPLMEGFEYAWYIGVVPQVQWNYKLDTLVVLEGAFVHHI